MLGFFLGLLFTFSPAVVGSAEHATCDSSAVCRPDDAAANDFVIGSFLSRVRQYILGALSLLGFEANLRDRLLALFSGADHFKQRTIVIVDLVDERAVLVLAE